MDNCPDALEQFVIKNEQNPCYVRFWREVNQECDPLAAKVLVEQFSVPDSYVLRSICVADLGYKYGVSLKELMEVLEFHNLFSACPKEAIFQLPLQHARDIEGLVMTNPFSNGYRLNLLFVSRKNNGPYQVEPFSIVSDLYLRADFRIIVVEKPISP